MTRWAVAGLVAGLVAVGLAGCGAEFSGGGPGDPGDPGLPAVPSVKEEKDLPALPLDRYEASTRDIRRHTEAQARVTQSCMRKLGFEDFPRYPASPKMANSFEMTAVAMSSYPYGPLDLDSARRWGYGWDPERPLADSAQSEGRAVTAREQKALDGWRGKPADGCASRGADRLTEGVQDKTRMYTYVPRRRQSLDKAVAGDERVREALDTWSECLESKGVKRYETPSDAFGDKAWGRGNDHGGNTDRTEEELATATADVECKREHNTAGVWWVVRREKQRADVARHKDAYDGVRADQARVRANVKRALGEK
ncbi:hypothetical protein ACFVXC_09525 [Streptomyces sp. NPDC058257]|uniref:hypothetical protein n=1 Tax=Streptomyces sp. NPDC058257 TaxID=3346409 RepID=UPI0036E3B041